MKLSLDSVSYAGHFYEGEVRPIEDVIRRAAKWGYEDFFPHRLEAYSGKKTGVLSAAS
jgi:hypothetical protein